MRILLVEDDEVLRDGVSVGLQIEGFEVDAVRCCRDAQAGFDPDGHAAIILDIGLPDGSGLDLLATWRKEGRQTPILLLTARDMVSDRVAGLDLGADDYLGKPFDLTELSARLRAIVRRSVGRSSSTITIGPLTIDPMARVAILHDQDMGLSRREFAVLEALAENPRHILSRSVLEDRIYGWNEEVESNAVEVHIHKLRQKLGREWIETVRGEGYRIMQP